MGDKIDITVKLATGQTFDITVDPSKTVGDVKEQCADLSQIQPNNQRLILRGRILNNDTLLSTLNLKNGVTLHLVSAQSAAVNAKESIDNSKSNLEKPNATQSGHQETPSLNIPNFGDMSNLGQNPLSFLSNEHLSSPQMQETMRNLAQNITPDAYSSLLSNPAVQNMMTELTNNPQMLENIVQNNPFLQQMASNDNVLQSILSNPDMRAGTQPSDRATQNNNINNQSNLNNTSAAPNFGDFSNMVSQLTQNNPNLRGQLDQMLRGMNTNTNTSSNPNMNIPNDQLYAVQLNHLAEMGFIDNEASLKALVESNGDIDQAIEKLLQQNMN